MFIFLDIDGVMVPAKSWKSPELLDDGFAAFSSKATSVLQSIIFENTTIMLTTSHKSNYTIQEWKEIFEKRGIAIKKIECLKNNINNLSRKDEILEWFHTNKLNEPFVIIDDDTSLNSLPNYLKEKLILTSPIIGLTVEHLDSIKEIFNKYLKLVS